ncbi:DNA-binding transcriptional regulator, MarR family [Quadrisphaera granulorum]|uniref:DNA-binding MarR family transcriptional regulator n=1 Tax=Quadrisphaera granulorum TaxID=317664 RepID=A0A316A763_9ACTN|nr:MarR family transcriptional regulator [Quadrisphaera granulorum]PWJ53776.1 DNA-binding MarR family transcriptional regulator [Quadrisphaera granulorum]SZE96533.1 DNA-binding transcriptional regulator, MarR family [Quadrisphaera granulorum]
MAGSEGAQDDGERGQLQRVLIDDVRTLAYRTQHLAHAFAEQQAMHPTDLEAMVHVMQAETDGDPLTAGRLAGALNLSSAATTSVVDRLERAGHVQRERDDIDRRRVHLRITREAMGVAGAFFGPLGQRTDAVMAQFSEAELSAVHRFLVGFSQAMEDAERAHRSAGERSSEGAPQA